MLAFHCLTWGEGRGVYASHRVAGVTTPVRTGLGLWSRSWTFGTQQHGQLVSEWPAGTLSWQPMMETLGQLGGWVPLFLPLSVAFSPTGVFQLSSLVSSGVPSCLRCHPPKPKSEGYGDQTAELFAGRACVVCPEGTYS